MGQPWCVASLEGGGMQFEGLPPRSGRATSFQFDFVGLSEKKFPKPFFSKSANPLRIKGPSMIS
jgi:hypothetical protein